MAEPQTNPTPDDLLNQVAAAVVDRLVSVENLERYGQSFENVLTEFLKTVFYVVIRMATPAAVASLDAITQASEDTRAQRAHVLAASLRNIFGIKVDGAQLGDAFASGSSSAVSQAMVPAMLEAITGGSKSVDASDVPAHRYVQLVTNQALEGWMTGASIELLSAIVPGIEQIQTLGEASNRVATALGIGDSSSRVLRPYVDTLVVEPLRRKIDSTYRPMLLSPGEVAKQYWRGRLTREEAYAELALQGWSDRRSEMQIEGARRTLSVSDIRTLFDRGELELGEALAQLREAGYDTDRASDVLRLELVKRRERHELDMAGAAMSAYLAGDLSAAEFGAFMREAVSNPQERSFLEELAHARRALRQKRLSPNETRAGVRAGILNVRDYRDALRRDGYAEDAVLALELLLRHELDEAAAADELRAQAEADRALERAEREQAREARRLELEAERALRRRGSESELERAVVRGLIPLSRLEEVYRAKYDPDTVTVYLELVEDERARYVEQQAARAEAEKRGRARHVDVGTLDRAVLENQLALVDYRRRLEQLGFAPADVELLARTLEARKRDADEAAAARADAQAAASRRRIDLGRFEQLVRRGARSMADYRALLRSLDFDDAAVAALVELLELRIADDAAARDARGADPAAPGPRGLTVDQFRRSVVLGLKGPREYEAFLLEQQYTADAIALLMAELAENLAAADDARRRREAPAPVPAPRALSLDTVRRAAKLGIVSVEQYRARLEGAGYDTADVELELELLFHEIADVQAARARRAELERELGDRGLSLATLANAVRRGLEPLEAYRARALELGYSAADVATLARVLADELRSTELAKARRAELAGEFPTREPALAELEAATRAGVLTLEEYAAALRAAGLAADDAALLADWLGLELAGAAT